MKKQLWRWAGILSLIALSGLLLPSCGGGSDTTGEEGGGGGEASSGSGETINLLTWETYDEPEWLEEFEEETGIKVNSSNVGSPAEMFSKVKANPSQYDIVLNTAGWFPQYVSDGLLEPIDESKVTEMKNIKLGFDWRGSTEVDGKLYLNYSKKVKEMWEKEQNERIEKGKKNWENFKAKKPEHKG